MGIHHNTIKKLASYGLTITEVGNEFVVRDAEGKEVARDITPRTAADAAVQVHFAKKLPKGEQKAVETSEEEATVAKTAKKAAKAKKTPKNAKAAVKSGKTIVSDEYRKDYNKDDNCGDKIATALTEYLKEGKLLNIEKLAKLAEDNGIDMRKYSSLNNGQKSMNIRNILRARAKRGDKVKIGSRVFA